MKLAFGRHYEAAHALGTHRRSRLLLFFYAAEVGLKAICMRDCSLANSDDLLHYLKMTYNKRDGHDLMTLIDAAKIPATDVAGGPANFTVDGVENGRSFPEYRIHEASRYGAKVCPTYLSQIEEWLNDVCQVVKHRLGVMN